MWVRPCQCMPSPGIAKVHSADVRTGKMYEMMYNEDDALSGKISYSSGARSASPWVATVTLSAGCFIPERNTVLVCECVR
jgi:hypothetical protein